MSRSEEVPPLLKRTALRTNPPHPTSNPKTPPQDDPKKLRRCQQVMKIVDFKPETDLELSEQW